MVKAGMSSIAALKSDTSVNAGATLRLNPGSGNGIDVGKELLTLDARSYGSGAAVAGQIAALDNASGTNGWCGPVFLANTIGNTNVTVVAGASVLVNVPTGTSLTFGGSIGQSNASPVAVPSSSTRVGTTRRGLIAR